MRRLALLTALCCALAGCGDDGGGGDDQPKLSKPQFITRADAACRKVGDAARKRLLAPDAPDPTKPEGLAETIEANVKVGRDLERRLRALGPPKDPVLDRFFAAGRSSADALEGVARSARGRDEAAVQRGVAAARRETTETQDLAVEYGFKVCGQGGG